ncbi:MAG: fimbrillin family protein [Bacteroidales bacterium]|nr:fimbrillin family protein [Bacteroidales bacterium]
MDKIRGSDMKNIGKIIFFGIFYGCISCSVEVDTYPTDKEILLSPFMTYDTETISKANLYDASKLIVEDKGNFSVTSYKTGTTERYFLNFDRIYYFKDDGSWRFYDASVGAQGVFYQRYWPTYALDFFAYMPYDNQNTGVTVLEKAIQCSLPTDYDKQAQAQEFIYAYAPGQKYTEQNNGQVNLNFIHPFSAIRFELGAAHGNTNIEKIELRNIAYKGRLDVSTNPAQADLADTDWVPDNTDNKGTITIPVGKTVGAVGANGIQLNAKLGTDLLVLPQVMTDDITIYVKFRWNNVDYTPEVKVNTSQTSPWQPGKIYTYKLNLGDSAEDIISTVTVTPWTDNEYKNDIDVE